MLLKGSIKITLTPNDMGSYLLIFIKSSKSMSMITCY